MILKWINFIMVLTILVVIITVGYFFAFKNIISQNEKIIVSSERDNVPTSVVEPTIQIIPTPTPIPPPQKLSNPPEIVKAVYVTGYSAGSKKYLDYLGRLFENTEINAVVVNIKEDDGRVSYNSGVEEVERYSLYNGAIKDIDALVRFFHDKNIYVIGRIVVFSDSIYSKIKPNLAIFNKPIPTPLPAVASVETIIDNPSPIPIIIPEPTLWKDNKGFTWLDPTAKGAWDYNISLAKDAFYHGFDEINFDYIRFPSDGKTQNMGFHFWDTKTTKSGVIKSFFEYVRKELIGEKISVDLFGQTTTNKDDMGIGQLLENAFENFDYISPMVYPSHYMSGFKGFSNPADHPYEIVKYAMETALSRKNDYSNFLLEISSAEENSEEKLEIPQKLSTKFRPWLQDFDMGAIYNTTMVKLEIQATQDALGEDYAGYMLWNPSNIYTQGAILKMR